MAQEPYVRGAEGGMEKCEEGVIPSLRASLRLTMKSAESLRLTSRNNSNKHYAYCVLAVYQALCEAYVCALKHASTPGNNFRRQAEMTPISQTRKLSRHLKAKSPVQGHTADTWWGPWRGTRSQMLSL